MDQTVSDAYGAGVPRPAAVAPVAEQPAPGHARRRLFTRVSTNTWRLVTLVALLGVWHLASLQAGTLLLPSPVDVVPAFVGLVRSGELLAAAASSLVVFAGGYGLALATGIPLGVLMGGIRRLGETLDIFVNALNSTPRVALVPFVVLWFGLDVTAKVVIVWLLAVCPIVISTYAGVQNTDAELIEAARSFGATQRQIFRHIMLPAAMPYIVTGLRLGASSAMIGTIVAELYTALSGLGYLLARYGNTFQTARYFAPVLVLATFGILISQSLKALERRLARWKTTTVEV